MCSTDTSGLILVHITKVGGADGRDRPCPMALSLHMLHLVYEGRTGKKIEVKSDRCVQLEFVTSIKLDETGQESFAYHGPTHQMQLKVP